MRIKGILVAVFSLFVLSTASFAASTGDAGCGLGSVIFQKNSKLSQSLALTTNSTFLNQLFGITSGTSNCAAKGLVKNDAELKYYAEANLPSLKVDVARGSGESLVALAQIMGCSKDRVAHFSATAQSRFESLFPNDQITAADFVTQAEHELSGVCQSNGA